MLILIVHWCLSALALVIVANIVPGIEVRSFGTALIAAVIIGFVNATLGFILKILTLPLTLLTFGLFFLIINAMMLELAAALVPGFDIYSFWSAFIGAIVLSLVNFVLRFLFLQP